MEKLVKYKVNWLQRMIFILLSLFIFQGSSTALPFHFEIGHPSKNFKSIISAEDSQTKQTNKGFFSDQSVTFPQVSGPENVHFERIKSPAAKGGAKASKTLTQQADEMVKLNGGKNSITLRTSTKQIRYDLGGKAYIGVPTPHKQIYNKNFFKGEVRSITRASKDAIPMSQQEIRMLRKYI